MLPRRAPENSTQSDIEMAGWSTPAGCRRTPLSY
jgi:hypothetical protein